jgi:lipopolysaccharide/colanic/teichoic acid biosynthesis glycosyltransferase
MSGLPHSSPFVAPASPEPLTRRHGRHTADRTRRAAATRPRVLSETLFRDALVRERRRADRFEEPFVLILISFDSRSTSPRRWGQLASALRQPDLDADLIGWFEQGAVLGLIRSFDDRYDLETKVASTAAMQEQLLRRLAPARAGAFSVRFEVYSPQSDTIPPVLFDGPRQNPTPRELFRDGVKRVLDVLGSAALLIVFLPVFLLVAALVKISSKGPVFFRQQRIGQNGRPFHMLKFRTMCVNADPSIHQQYVERFIESNDSPAPDGNVVCKIVNDPRVTPIGHFLRRSSLDELPQFWNVLIGEMSLVGPRPPVPYEVAKYKRWHLRRVLEAKPGITGLWQVTGRSRTTFDDMVRLDLRYARTRSVWTDLKILLATPRAVLSGKGAH